MPKSHGGVVWAGPKPDEDAPKVWVGLGTYGGCCGDGETRACGEPGGFDSRRHGATDFRGYGRAAVEAQSPATTPVWRNGRRASLRCWCPVRDVPVRPRGWAQRQRGAAIRYGEIAQLARARNS